MSEDNRIRGLGVSTKTVVGTFVHEGDLYKLRSDDSTERVGPVEDVVEAGAMQEPNRVPVEKARGVYDEWTCPDGERLFLGGMREPDPDVCPFCSTNLGETVSRYIEFSRVSPV